ncbi:MAG: hypothetical protein EHM72_19810 [Calditrichaeota bacterium]|nr:MAG: hypothetical protein EHM72_19810 [Calditrichota bacterium]
MGLEIKMPDINHSEWQYIGKNKSIRVGLMQLKSINRGAMIDVLKYRREKGPFSSFHHFLQRTKMDAADIAILIKAGCFDELEPGQTRPQLLWQLKSYFAVTQTDRKKGTLSLFEVEASPNLPQPPAFDEETTLQQEVEALGFLISRHPLTLYRAQLNELSYIKGSELKKYIGQRITCIGWFVTGKVTSTKQEQMMEFISFEDTTAIYETTFFPKTYDRFIHMVSSDRPLILRGKVEAEFGAVTLSVDQVEFV